MKNRILAALLALFFGWIGIHKFYLRDTGSGIFYIILMAIGSSMRLPISMFLGFLDALVLFTMSDDKFDQKYNKEYDRRYDRNVPRYQDRPQNRYESRDPYTNRRSAGGYEVRRDNYRNPPSPPQAPKRPRENPFKKTGISKYKEYDLQGAIEDFVKGIELDPQDVALHFNIACAYSLTEQPEKGFYHLSKAVELGFKDYDKIKTHDDLAYLRIQPEFENFENNGYRLGTSARETPARDSVAERESETIEIPRDLLQDDILLSQLQKLSELRNKGLLSEKEYNLEKEKLIRR